SPKPVAVLSRSHVPQLLLIPLPVLELVQRIHEGESARHDDVGVGSLSRHRDTVLAYQTGDPTLRVGAAGDGIDAESLELVLGSGDLLDRLVAGVDHAVASRLVDPLLAAHAHPH